jgi:hypothetical protein
MVTPELEPYVVYRLQNGQIECAIWQLQGGPGALALFLSGESAATYQQATHPGPEWKVLRPPRQGLLHLLRACYQAGILHAVLDPDREKARQVFDLKEVLSVVGELP